MSTLQQVLIWISLALNALLLIRVFVYRYQLKWWKTKSEAQKETARIYYDRFGSLVKQILERASDADLYALAKARFRSWEKEAQTALDKAKGKDPKHAVYTKIVDVCQLFGKQMEYKPE